MVGTALDLSLFNYYSIGVRRFSSPADLTYSVQFPSTEVVVRLGYIPNQSTETFWRSTDVNPVQTEITSETPHHFLHLPHVPLGDANAFEDMTRGRLYLKW